MKQIIIIVSCSILSAFIAVLAYDHIREPEQIIIEQSEPISRVNMEELLFSGRVQDRFVSAAPTNFIDAADKGRPAVVFIRALQDAPSSRRNQGLSGSTGSGVIISPDGYIVTNNHVVEEAKNIQVTLDDNREFKAKIVGNDPTSDLALLKIEEKSLPFLVFGNSDSLEIGEWVLAIGNPFRLQSTITAGIVSAKARNINILQRSGIESFIQTDAAVNPGNSGGALINTNSELVGINTAIMTYSGKYEGFSFAIPSNLARKIVYDLKNFGAVQRGWLGITINSVDFEKSRDLNLPTVSGVYVEMVEAESAARDAGILKGDVIVEVNGVETLSTPEFMEQVGIYRPGDIISIKYVRNGKFRETEVTLRNQLNTTDFVAVRKDQVLLDLGFELRDLDGLEVRRLDRDGVYVVSILRESKIDRTNMDAGYIITSINGKDISSVQELVDVLEESQGVIYLEGFYENYPGAFPYSFYKD